MRKERLRALFALLFAFVLCITQVCPGVDAKAAGEPTTYTVEGYTILNENKDVDNVLIKSGATLEIGEGGYLAANYSFVLEEGAKIVTSRTEPVIEIREGVETVTGFERYYWNGENYVEYNGLGEAYVYEYMNIGTEESTQMAWVRRDIMGPGPLDWFGLEDTEYQKEIQFDRQIPSGGYGSIEVSKINGSDYTKTLTTEESFDPEANTAEFSDDHCNLTRIHLKNGSGASTATIEFKFTFVDKNQNFELVLHGPDFFVCRWDLENSEYNFGGTPIVNYTPAEGGMSATLEIRLTDDYTDAELRMCMGKNPGVSVRFNDDSLSSTVSEWLASAVTGLEMDEYSEQEYRFSFESPSGTHQIDFRSLKTVENYKGFMYFESTNEWDNPVKRHVSNDETLVLDPTHSYEIELRIDPEAPLYDHTYCASISDYGSNFTINGEAVEHNARKSYTGNEITLSYTLPEGLTGTPVVMARYEMGSMEERVQFTGNTATITTDGYPIFFEICWSEDEYNFNRLPCNWDTETQIEYSVGENGSITLTRDGSPLSGARASYNGWTREVVAKEGSPIHFEITANDGYKIDTNRFEMRCSTGSGDVPFNVAEDTTYIGNLTISEDATTASGDWNVTALNSLWVEFCPTGGGQGNPGGPGPEGPNPGGTHTAADAKEAIESYLIAYAPASSGTSVKNLAKNEIWNVFFGGIPSVDGTQIVHDADYSNIFESREAFDSAIVIGELTSEHSEISKPDSTKLSYYPFTVTMTDDSGTVTANGMIYNLDSEYDMIVRTIKGGATKYQVISVTPYNEGTNTGYDAFHPYILSCEFDIDSEGIGQVEVFGNGATFVNTSDSGNRAQCFGGHITGEHTGFYDCKLSYKLEVYNTTFKGVKVSGNGGDAADGGKGLAAAWSWFSMDTIATNGTTASSPMVYNIYVGNTKIYLDSMTGIGSNKAIKAVECSLPTAARAVKITANGTRFVVEPLSNFYTELPLVITYTDDTKGYLKINIVAMDIQDNPAPGGSSTITIWHGTDHSQQFDCPERNAITATFYYTTDVDPIATGGPRVILEATYTWRDGSVTRRTITSPLNSALQTHVGDHKVNADDFVLWKGTNDNKPVKIEVIALKPDTDDDEFAGALFGGGAGITWTQH